MPGPDVLLVSTSPESRRIVGFGEFEVDTEARVLRRRGERVPLQAQRRAGPANAVASTR